MDQISWPFLTFSWSVAKKTGSSGTHFSVRRLFRELEVTERFKQEAIYGLSTGTKISGYCREEAIVGSWSLVEGWAVLLKPTAFKKNQVSHQPPPQNLSNPSSVQQLLCMFFVHNWILYACMLLIIAK